MSENELTIGQRVRKARKAKGYNQTELANILNKSLRTIQKYENGEIEISLSMINELANALDTTATYLLGYKTETSGSAAPEIKTFADVLSLLFKLETVDGLKFDIDVKRPPRADNWECSLKFKGKAKTELNADMCLFLEDWKDAKNTSSVEYEEWKDRTLAYYARLAVTAKGGRNEKADSAVVKKVTPSE